jgi:hypothetical protein
VEVLTLAKEVFFVVFVADVRELGGGTRVHCGFHVYDVAYMPFVVLMISIYDKNNLLSMFTEKAMGSLWGSWSPLPWRPSQTFYFMILKLFRYPLYL